MTITRKNNMDKLFIRTAEVHLEKINFQNPLNSENESIALEFEDSVELVSLANDEVRIRVSRRLFSSEKESFKFEVAAILILTLDAEKTQKLTERGLIKYLNDNSAGVINPSGVMDKISYTIASVSLTFNDNPHFTPPIFFGEFEKAEVEKIASSR